MNFFKILSLIILLFSSYARADKALNIVTTSSPLAAIFHMITTNDDKITYLVNHGCPHNYQMQPSQIHLIKKANIIAYINEEFDNFILKASSNNEKSYVIKFSNLDLSLMKNSSGFTNWHVWMDTKNVRLMLFEIMDVVSKLRPQKKDTYLDNYNKSMHLLDLLDKKAATLSASTTLLLADNLEYLFTKFKTPPSKILLGSKQATIEYVKNLRAQADSGKFYCAVISNHQSEDYYNNMLNNKLKIVTLNPENWLINEKDSPELIYFSNVQSMLNNLHNSCSGINLE